MPNVLDEIVSGVRQDLAAAKKSVPEEALRTRIAARPRLPPSFREALAARPGAGPAADVRVIAEVKIASPSRGFIARGANPVAIARAYAANGAAAISVLTERRRFHGSLETLVDVARTVPIPVLRKDFIVEAYQVLEAAASGAAAVLLIAALHDRADLYALLEAARAVQLDALVEVHDERELERAIGAGASIVGVNNRDLKTLAVDLDTSIRLAPLIPADVLKVAESGIKRREDIDRLAAAGYGAFLVGESLMEQTAPGGGLAALLRPGPGGAVKRTGPKP